MAQMNKIAALILTLIIGIGVQAFFFTIDRQNMPNLAAAEFSKAYFQLDSSMAEKICTERLTSSEDVDLVDKYIYLATQEAKERGFNSNFMQYKFYNITTEIISKSWENAQVRITGKRRVAINPAYPLVTKLFNLGATHEVNETIDLVKENGEWKVCGNFFDFHVK